MNELIAIASGVVPGSPSVAGLAQPLWRVALHVRSSRTAIVPPASATYTVWLGTSTATAVGRVPGRTVGDAAAQPAERHALQRRESIRVTPVGPGTYTVAFAGSAAGVAAAPPSAVGTPGIATSGTRDRQPRATSAEHRAGSITHTVSSSTLAV